MKRARSLSTLLASLLLATPGFAAAQSLPDGVPDLSGVWQKSSRGMALIEGTPPLTAWGQERFDLAKPIHGPRTVSATESNAAELTCLPMGFPATYFRPRPFEIIQLPDRAVMLFDQCAQSQFVGERQTIGPPAAEFDQRHS